MQKSKWLYSLVALFVVFISFSALTGEFENEKDLIKTADKQFEAGEYAQCLELFSQLVSNHAQNPDYLYKYGTCLLFATEDKLQSLRYLKFAVGKPDVDPIAFYYYGKALQTNYEFDEAINQYKKFKSKAKSKDVADLKIDHLIDQCNTAKKMIYDFKKMDVVNKKTVGKKEFFRSYRLGSMKRNIIVTPEEFQTRQDKKSDDYSLIVHNPMNEVVYFSSYNTKGSLGGKDIFKVLKMPDGTFSEPVNLGPAVNTNMDEDYPYLHPNGRVLYFASKGRNGLGGYDIFRSELDTNTNLWGYAVNLGFSVNSPADDILYVSDMDENIAYFSSNRTNKQGEITVYKILSNKNQEPIVIVRGQIEVEGSQNHQAKITVYNNAGEVLSEYNSKRESGNFVMTLEEDQNYTIGLALPGKGESKSQLAVPKKSEWDMISKKFTIAGDGKVVVKEAPELLASSSEKSKLLRESAMLDVNQTSDVDFNTKVKRPQAKAPKTATDEDAVASNEAEAELITQEGPKEGDAASISENIYAGAEKELNEIKAAKQKIEKQIDATYYVANKKKIKADILKDEIEQVSEDLSMAYSDEEKAELTKELTKKKNELKANSASATAAIQLAKSKERELEVKAKQEKLAQTYADAIKKAETSANDMAAIKELEKTRDELDKLEQEIALIKEKDGSSETLAKADVAKKKLADLKVKQQRVEQDVIDIKAEQRQLKAQAENTKNKGLKEELNLQAEELNKEIANAEVQNNLLKAKVSEAESEYEVLSSTNNVYDEVYAEAEDEALVAMSEDQKQNLKNDVKKQDATVQEALNEVDNNEVVSVSNTKKRSPTEEAYLSAIAGAQQEKAAIEEFQGEIDILSTVLQTDLDAERKQEINKKIEQLKADQKQSLEALKNNVDNANALQKDLSPEIVAANESETQKVQDLAADFEQFNEQLNKQQVNDTKTEELDIAVETATEREKVELLSNSSGIKFDNRDPMITNSNIEKLEESLKEKQNSATKKLLDANKIQIEHEKNSGTGTADQVVKLQNEALEEQFEIARIQGEINREIYVSKQENIEKQLTDKGLSGEQLKLKAQIVSQSWEMAVQRRKDATETEDQNDKIRLVNEARELESIALENQKAFELLVSQTEPELIAATETPVDESGKGDESDESDEGIASEELVTAESAIDTDENSSVLASGSPSTEEEVVQNNASEQTSGEDVVDRTSTIEETQPAEVDDFGNELVKVTPDQYNSERPSEEAIVYANEAGYGVKRDVDFTYTNSGSVNAAMEEAKQEEKVALDYFFESEQLKAEAAENPGDEKKLLKKAEKLISKGQKAQEEANEKYRLVNEAELNFNKEEIEFALQYNDIQKKDSAKILLKQADELFEEAAELRKEAKKEKNYQASVQLVNEAYKKELEAIGKQNYIITGELDGEFEKETPEDVIIVPEREENEYTRQADAIRKQAELETDPYEKRKLFEVARTYDLAGNTDRTQRLLDDLNEDKSTFENNKVLIVTAREQSNNNVPANKAYFSELASDSLFQIADSIRVLAESETDQVERLKLITKANEGMREAKEKQVYAIKKYRESKAAPGQDGFVAAFRQQDVAEQLAAEDEGVKSVDELIAQGSTEAENGADNIASEEITNTTNVIPAEETVANTPTDEGVAEEGERNAVDLQMDNSLATENSTGEQEDDRGADITNEIETQESEGGQSEEAESTQEIAVIPAEETNEIAAEESYKRLIQEADDSEAQEAARVDEIVHLKNQSGINKNKSEEILAQVDDLKNEAEIMKKISEANKLRSLAEEQEIEANNKELILKNNVAEARAKRKEADMILAGLDEEEQAEIKASTERTDPNLEKVRSFLGDDSAEEIVTTETGENDPMVEEEIIAKTPPNTGNEVAVQKVKEVEVELPTASPSGIDYGNISLLSQGGAENSIVEDEFSLNSNRRYTSADDIPIDPKMPEGLIYQVQVGAFRNKIDPAIFNGLSPLVGEKTSTGIIRYKVGYFRGFKSANMAKGRIQNLGYRDAFVVVFYNGQRISLDEATTVLEKADESEKFIYENLVEDEVQQLKSLGIKEDEGLSDPTDVTSSPVVVAKNPSATSPNSIGVPSGSQNGLNNNLLAINGTFFTVQVGVFSTPRTSADLNGVVPLYTEKTSNGYLRYTTGIYQDFSSADKRKEVVRNQGINDAFVTAYSDNKRITAARAKEIVGETGSTVSNSTSINESTDQTTTSNSGEVMFRVQVGAYRSPITYSETPVFKDLTDYQITNVKTASGLLVYMVGSFKTKQEANDFTTVVKQAGGTDCFVVATLNGERISMQRALELSK